MSTPGRGEASITPTELSDRIRGGDAPRIIDVREAIEYQIARIEGAELIPLSELPSRVGSLDPMQEIVMVCHHGVRSRHACEYLIASGFTRVLNLTGGIDRWSEEVDPAVPRY